MKRLLVFALVGICCANVAFAQRPGTIAIFSDAGGTDCNFVEGGYLIFVYFFHIHYDFAMGSRFMVDVTLTDWLFLGDYWDFRLWGGHSVAGVEVYYEACLSGPTYLGFAQFFVSTSAPPCSPIGIVGTPATQSGEIEVIDCTNTWQVAAGGQGVVNPDQTCMCSPPVPVEQTTWSQVKALYR